MAKASSQVGVRLAARRERAARLFQGLRAAHPDAHCELEHDNPFQLIVATVLSAQSTDVAVNKLTPALFARYPDAAALARADKDELERALASIGMFRQKTKNLIGLAQGLVERHAGQVPKSLAELIKLPGVGRKTANVVLGVAFGAPEGVVVDTHVQRISQRLGWTKHADPPEIEQDLMRLFPESEWDILSHTLIFHGRRVCSAQRPACAACSVSSLCPSAFKAEKVGRKPQRSRPPDPAKTSGAKRASAKQASKRPGAKKAVSRAAVSADKAVKREKPAPNKSRRRKRAG